MGGCLYFSFQIEHFAETISPWVPAFAGMTILFVAKSQHVQRLPGLIFYRSSRLASNEPRRLGNQIVRRFGE